MVTICDSKFFLIREVELMNNLVLTADMLDPPQVHHQVLGYPSYGVNARRLNLCLLCKPVHQEQIAEIPRRIVTLNDDGELAYHPVFHRRKL